MLNRKGMIVMGYMSDVIRGAVWGLVMCLLLTLLFGCKTKYVGVPEYHTFYKARTDSFMKYDSVWVHDSVNMWTKNDTVFKDRWHTELKWRDVDRVRHNTVLKTDSVMVPYEVEKVVYKNNKEERVLWIGVILVMVGIMIGGKIIRRGT